MELAKNLGPALLRGCFAAEECFAADFLKLLSDVCRLRLDGYGGLSLESSNTVGTAKTCSIRLNWVVMGIERPRLVLGVKHSQTLITDFFKGSNVRHEEGVSSESVSSCKCTGSSAPSNSSSSSQSIHGFAISKSSPPLSFTSACSLSHVSETCML